MYFGGSFNPPHVAHVRCAAAAARAAGLDGVVLVPTGQPRLKIIDEVAPAADRLAMTRLAAAAAVDLLAAAAVPFRVDASEVLRAGPTFTIDTVTALRSAGVSPVSWLIGADQLLNLHRWHHFEDLLRTAIFRVMARPGYAIDWTAVHPAVRSLRDHVVVVPQLDVSATHIRRRVRNGEPIDGLVAPAVGTYLREHGIYKDARSQDHALPGA